MAKEILMNTSAQEKRVAIVTDGRLEEFYIERPQDKTIVGNVYKGRIDAVLPSIGAAFVDIGLPKKGFLYLSEIESLFEAEASEHRQQKRKEVKKGQEVLVQVVKESFGNKGPRLTCEIGLPGRYLVLMPQESQTGVSRRIESDEERKRLRQILHELNLPKDVGIIVRTAAEGKSKQDLNRDAQFLLKLWARIKKTIESTKAPALIYEEYDLNFRIIRDSFTEDVSKLIIDNKPEFYRLIRFMRTFLSYLTRRVEVWRGDADLFDAKDVEKQVEKLFDTRIYLKSKAYIIIEPTEGLVVIDVNSGGFKRNISQEDAAFKVNSEAAVEVAHQLKLRDLGGIVVIDFIDMEKEGHRRELLNVLKKALSNDRAKYDIMGVSKFGLVEMTRERVHNTVVTLSLQPCPYCQGKGRVKSPATMAIFVVKEIKRFLKDKKDVRQINISLHPSVIDELLRDKSHVANLERLYHIKINLVANPSYRYEDISLN